MAGLVADTHVALWYLFDSPRLSARATSALKETIGQGAPVFVSAVSVVEIVYLAEKGRIPSKALDRLLQELNREDSGFVVAPLDLSVAEGLRRIPREDVPDMPDRIIAATAQTLGVPLVTRDGKIRAAAGETIW